MSSVGIHSMRTRPVTPLIRAVAFADEPRWHIYDPLPAATMTWKALSVVPEGSGLRALLDVPAGRDAANPQIRSAGLYGDDAEPQGPAFRDISDVVL